jgi:protein-tyrosine phosphatase
MTTANLDIQLSAPVNLRDMGGIPINGGVLRPDLAIRTDDLSIVTDEIAHELIANGLSAVIDLRTADEVAITGRGPLANHSATYHHLPLMANLSGSMSRDAPQLNHEVMGRMYLAMVETAAPQLVTALNIIAYTPGATAFHCAAGRDRTGVLAAALLLALGAHDDDIVTDYARTAQNMTAIMERTRGSMGPLLVRLGLDHDTVATGGLTDGPMDISMRILLEGLRSHDADGLALFRAAGLSDDTIARLRKRALGA